MSKKHYEGGGGMDDSGSLIMGDSGPFAGASGGAGAASPGGMSAMEKFISGVKGNAKYFVAGALLGGTQGVKGALMAPMMAAMMQKKGMKAPIPGTTSTGAPDMAGPSGMPSRMVQLAQSAGPPMPGGDNAGPTAYKKGGIMRRAMGGPAMPVAPIPAAGMATMPVAAMKKGGAVVAKKIGGGLTGLGIGGIKDKFMSMQDKNKIPLKKHNYPAIRKPELGRAIKPDLEMKKGGTMDKSEFKKAIKKAAGGCMETERKAMGGPIRQKHEMAMSNGIPTKQEPPSGTQRRAMGGSVVAPNTISSGKVKGWGSARNTGGGKSC